MSSNNTSIPKIIHYCWFGGKEKPRIVKKCISSWKKYLSEYEIIEWNESNFDLNSNPYVKEAYELKRYAFVSDYVRVFVLFNFGGIYLDTDVEVLKPFDDLLNHDSFWGFEEGNYIATSTIGAVKGNEIIRAFLESYKEKKLKNENGDEITNVATVTEILKQQGLLMNGEYQEIKNIGAFYPQEYFSPYDYINCTKRISRSTYTIHYFYKSWLPFSTRIKTLIKKMLSSLIGGNNVQRLREILPNKYGG
ncbi:glycosyltransferase family 32 protein [Bacillus sp. 1P02SD]|uniref:glycosyltransferase family 32 protein n=1 Tax=Bacillus sp. 1P02SD TaxID=3132264 RepID=UPI0039A21EDA